MLKKLILPVLLLGLTGCEVTKDSSGNMIIQSKMKPISIVEMREKARQEQLELAFKAMMHKALPHLVGFHSAVRLHNNELLAIVVGVDKEGYMQVYFPYSTQFKDNQKEACTQHLKAETLQNNTFYFNKLPTSTCTGDLGNQKISIYLSKEQDWYIDMNGNKTKLKTYANMPTLSRSIKAEYDIAVKEKIARDKKAEEERIKREKEEAEARKRRAEQRAREASNRSNSSYSSSSSYKPKYYTCSFYCTGQWGATRSGKITDNAPVSDLTQAQEYIKKKYGPVCAKAPFYKEGGGASVGFPDCEAKYW